MSLLHSFSSPHQLQRQSAPTGLSDHCLMQRSGGQYILKSCYHLWICSLRLTPTLQFFLQSGHLNWYMQQHSLAQGEPLLSGKPKSPLTNCNSNFNTTKGASKIQFRQHGVETPKILLFQQMRK